LIQINASTDLLSCRFLPFPALITALFTALFTALLTALFTASYLVSMYWAFATMTTVGFGDVSAHTYSNLEMMMSIISTLVGATVFAYVIGQVLAVVININPCADEIKRRKHLIKAFVDEKKLPQRFKWTARQNLMYISSRQTCLDLDRLLGNLPEYLRKQVVQEMWGRHLAHSNIFGKIHKTDNLGCLSVLLPMLRPAIYEVSLDATRIAHLPPPTLIAHLTPPTLIAHLTPLTLIAHLTPQINSEVCSDGESLPQMFFVELGQVLARRVRCNL
jgi:hypothetical protein